MLDQGGSGYDNLIYIYRVSTAVVGGLPTAVIAKVKCSGWGCTHAQQLSSVL